MRNIYIHTCVCTHLHITCVNKVWKWCVNGAIFISKFACLKRCENISLLPTQKPPVHLPPHFHLQWVIGSKTIERPSFFIFIFLQSMGLKFVTRVVQTFYWTNKPQDVWFHNLNLHRFWEISEKQKKKKKQMQIWFSAFVGPLIHDPNRSILSYKWYTSKHEVSYLRSSHILTNTLNKSNSHFLNICTFVSPQFMIQTQPIHIVIDIIKPSNAWNCMS